MYLYRLLPILFFSFFSFTVSGQTLQVLHQDSLSFRGLSVVSDQVIWVSGTKGTVGKSLDGGNTWEWFPVPGFETNDFRDIEGFDENTAVVMGISEPAYILRTQDGGKNWQIVFEDHTPGIFLDAMEFTENGEGLVLGDPLNGKFFMARSSDSGQSWTRLSAHQKPVADSGEACFASSGTNIRIIGSEALFVSGGLSSHLFVRNQRIPLPIKKGGATIGANSLAVKDLKTFIVTGGDFTRKEDTVKNCILTRDGGLTWIYPVMPPGGYRSCVEYISSDTWITCGLNGVDISFDGGLHWQSASTDSYHVVRKARNGKSVFLAGPGGKISRFVPWSSQ